MQQFGMMLFWGGLFITIALLLGGYGYELYKEHFAYAFPAWMEKLLAVVFGVMYAYHAMMQMQGGKGFLVGLFPALFSTIKWLWPLFLAPFGAVVISNTPIVNLAPKGFDMEFSRALTPLLAIVMAWAFWQFSRLQEVSRDSVAWVAIIVVSITVTFQSAMSGSDVIFGIALLSSTIAMYGARYIMGVEKSLYAYRVTSINAHVLLISGVFFLVLGFMGDLKDKAISTVKETAKETIKETIKEKAIEKKDEIKDKLDAYREKLKQQREQQGTN